MPEDAVGLLEDYIALTLRNATSSVLTFGILATFWSGWAAASAIVKAVNRAYELQETRPWWKLWGISVLMVLGFMLMIVSLAFVVFGPEVGGYIQSLTGLPEPFLTLWNIIRWLVAFVAVSLAHAVLYYLAPNDRMPFKWATPGGLTATFLILLSSVGLNLWAANLGRYDEIYEQVSAIMVLMLWLYVTGLMVLVGAEMNAVLARIAEERKGIEIIQPEGQQHADSALTSRARPTNRNSDPWFQRCFGSPSPRRQYGYFFRDRKLTSGVLLGSSSTVLLEGTHSIS